MVQGAALQVGRKWSVPAAGRFRRPTHVRVRAGAGHDGQELGQYDAEALGDLVKI